MPPKITPGDAVAYIGDFANRRGLYRLVGECGCAVCERRRENGTYAASRRYILRRINDAAVLAHVEREAFDPVR